MFPDAFFFKKINKPIFQREKEDVMIEIEDTKKKLEKEKTFLPTFFNK